MTLQDLTNWMNEQMNGCNSIITVSDGNGGGGVNVCTANYIATMIDYIDVNYDDNDISIVEDEEELNRVANEIKGVDELTNYDAVIKLGEWMDGIIYILYFGAEVEDVDLIKTNHCGDTLSWSFMGKNYSCTGEFYVDRDGKLHHTFFAPSGREIEIVTSYE